LRLCAALAVSALLVPGCDGDDESTNACSPVSVGDGNTAVDFELGQLECDRAHRIARASQDQTEPDYVSGGYHCMGSIDFGPNQRVRRVVYRCDRGDDSLRFVVEVG